MPVKIDFLANVADFLRGTSDASAALDDVAGSLDDLVEEGRRSGQGTGDELASGVQDGTGDATRAIGDVETKLSNLAESTAGQQAGGELGTQVRAGGGDAEQAVGRLEASFRDLAESAKRQSTTVGTDISTSVKTGTHEADEGVKTLKENSASNLKEVAASFDGTWQGAAGGAQGLIAEIAEGFGPVGLIAGAVAAGGLGLILSGIEGAKQKTEEYKQKVADLATQLIATGKTGGRMIGDIEQAVQDLAVEQDGLSLSKLYDEAKKAGTDYQELVFAIASGSPAEIAKVQKALDATTQAHIDQAKAAGESGSGVVIAARKQTDAQKDVRESLKEAAEVAKEAGRAQELAAKAGLSEIGLKAKAITQLHDAYVDAAGEVDDFLDAEKGVFDVEGYLKAFERRQQALRDYQETLATSELSPEAKSYIEGLGGEQAALLIAGYAKASEKQKNKLNDIWSNAGSESADSYKEALGDDLKDSTVRGPKVVAPSTDSYFDAVVKVNKKAQDYLDSHPIYASSVKYPFSKPLY